MTNTHLIWIPSLQKNVRFKELTNQQYRTILKNVEEDDNINFLYNINIILKDNLVDNLSYSSLTILDRFVIIIYLKILCYGSILQLSKECDNCKESVNIQIDLNNLLDKLGSKIDKSFITDVGIPDYPIRIACDIPTIQQEYDYISFHHENNQSVHTSEKNIERYLMGYIKQLLNGNNIIELCALNIPERNIVLSKIPAKLILKIKNIFIDPIYKIFNDIIFLDLNCKSCKEKFEIKMESDNLIHLLKLFFKDNNSENFLKDYFNISSIGHIECSFLEKITPKEMLIFNEFVKTSQKNNESNSEPNPGNLFENNYNNEIDGLSKSPSEFS